MLVIIIIIVLVSIIKLEGNKGDKMYKKKHKLTIIWVIIIILLAFVMVYTLNTKTELYINKIIKDIIYLPTRLIPDNNKEDIIGQNLNNELIEENKQLKKLLDIENTLSDFDTINATVIERNTTYWFNNITINKGKKDGIDVGMAVVTNEGIIGKIENVSYLTSTIKLITSNDKNNKISIRINSKDKTYNNILTTDVDGQMVITGIDKASKVEVGDIVVTSGLSETFPSGIIIGKISKIENDEYGISRKAFVESQTDINNIRFVSVLSRKISYE